MDLRLQSCGVDSEELGKTLRHLGLKKKRLVNLLPLLEFITWSLLNDDSKVRFHSSRGPEIIITIKNKNNKIRICKTSESFQEYLSYF